MWNTLELWSGRMVGCYKQDLTDHPNKSLEDNSAENHENYEISAPEVLRGTILVSIWDRDYSCDFFFVKECGCFLPLS